MLRGDEWYAIDRLSHRLFALADEQVKMVVHKAVDIIGTIAATRVAIVIAPVAHTVESIMYPCIIAVPYQGTLNLKDVLPVYTTHHDMIETGA